MLQNNLIVKTLNQVNVIGNDTSVVADDLRHPESMRESTSYQGTAGSLGRGITAITEPAHRNSEHMRPHCRCEQMGSSSFSEMMPDTKAFYSRKQADLPAQAWASLVLTRALCG